MPSLAGRDGVSLVRADASMKTALVTGACSGIGLAFAEQLAALGYELVLVSNRKAELEQVAARLAATVKTHAIVMDLARTAAAQELVAAVDQLGLEIDILVNNAGVFFFGEVSDAEPAKIAAMLELHVVTPSLLGRHLGRRMRDRRRGHLLFVSSISAWNDFPGIALYGASKKYLKSFALALRSELRPWGVNVTIVAPGATATGLYDPKVVDVGKATRLRIMTGPGPVARAALQAMFAGRALVVPGLASKLFAWGMALAPRWLIHLVRLRVPWLRRP
ncbi:MAG: SDR family NAD(P)-dependent oxidoreductase [Myxococcaceae bacterium]|nr:SDR family NAD(P)-dependent oxidoreductase [Myxococcaceae bacterium]